MAKMNDHVYIRYCWIKQKQQQFELVHLCQKDAIVHANFMMVIQFGFTCPILSKGIVLIALVLVHELNPNTASLYNRTHNYSEEQCLVIYLPKYWYPRVLPSRSSQGLENI